MRWILEVYCGKNASSYQCGSGCFGHTLDEYPHETIGNYNGHGSYGCHSAYLLEDHRYGNCLSDGVGGCLASYTMNALNNTMSNHLLSFYRFVQAPAIDWAAFDSHPIPDSNMSSSPSTHPTYGIFLNGCADSENAVVWILQGYSWNNTDNPAAYRWEHNGEEGKDEQYVPNSVDPLDTIEDSTLTISGELSNGDYTVEYWDTYSGTMIGDPVGASCLGGSLSVDLPAFERDIALKSTGASE